MKITIFATLLMMLAYFLVLYGTVGFIQDKRFRGAHGIGWVIEAIAVLLFVGAAVLVVWDGARNGFHF